MAHRSSAPALFTARNILKNFELVVIPPEMLSSGRVPNLRADEACLSVIVDYASNAYHITRLRPELYSWIEKLFIWDGSTNLAPQLASYLHKLEEAYQMLPKETNPERPTVTLETPVEFGRTMPQVLTISKPAREVARFVFNYYQVTPKNREVNESIDRMKMATIAEVSLNIHRTLEVPKLARRCKERLLKGEASLKEIQQSFRAMGILLEYFPNYEVREEEQMLL